MNAFYSTASGNARCDAPDACGYVEAGLATARNKRVGVSPVPSRQSENVFFDKKKCCNIVLIFELRASGRTCGGQSCE